jgi:hypothetical protein
MSGVSSLIHRIVCGVVALGRAGKGRAADII